MAYRDYVKAPKTAPVIADSYSIYDVHLNAETRNYGGLEWVVDGELGRATYPADLSGMEVRALYRAGKLSV
ncbi:MAG: hypothetical protein IJM76_05820 [Lachnospiraceae bacterium]|nr:hypothetical protein [Lachnospiraceae bacterium]